MSSAHIIEPQALLAVPMSTPKPRAICQRLCAVPRMTKPRVLHRMPPRMRGRVPRRTVEAHQQALQGFLDELTPWLRPADLPTLLGQPFTLFDHLVFTPRGDGDDEDVHVALSPGGEVVFRAWLRQRGLDPLVCSS
jgi:hypothetical protein